MKTLQAGLIGDHISRTRLPAALQIMCDAHGWMLDFSLIDSSLDEDFDLDATFATAHLDGWTGMTVTHPWKTEARRFVDAGMNAEVAHLGACNTIRFAGGVTGFNTDYTGILSVFKSHEETQCAGQVLMMGAGGVAEAMAPALAELGHHIFIYDLDETRAESLCQKLTGSAMQVSKETLGDLARGANGLVNATALGMAEYPGSAFEADWLGSQSWVFDAVYTPSETKFINDAQSKGIKTISGFELFCAMAMRSFEAYTGEDIDHAAMLPRLSAARPT